VIDPGVEYRTDLYAPRDLLVDFPSEAALGSFAETNLAAGQLPLVAFVVQEAGLCRFWTTIL